MRAARRAGARYQIWFHDMMLERADGRAVDLDTNKRRLEAAFLVVMRVGAENDGYNALVLAAGLMWREVALIRTISRFLRQIQVPYSQGYMGTTLVKHAPITADLVRLFAARFDPRLDVSAEERKAREDEIANRIESALDAVESLTRTASCAVSSMRSPRRSAQLSNRCWRAAELGLSPSICKSRARRPAAAATALEVFIYSPRVKPCTPALRQGGARRHPLVGPAAGLPHGNPRSCQGAAGQERGDRAGRRQRRLRTEAVEGRLTRTGTGRGHGGLRALHFDIARHHRQSARREGRCAR
jgi:hypothetical protein